MRETAIRFIAAALFLLLAILARAQNAPVDPAELKSFVKAQFGERFTVEPMPGSATVLVTGDLDGDGAEDAVIVAKCKDPLAGQAEFSYRVIDPLDGYYGWGDVNDTIRFASADPDRARVLLVVHSWRSATPKAKFAIINVEFSKLLIENITLKKKQRTVITAVDQGALSSYLFWDGKRWKYEPGALQ